MARRERRALELSERRKEKKRAKEAHATPPLELLERKRHEYAAAWHETATRLAGEGHYAWMANLLCPEISAAGRRLLEIGMGTGESTRVLRERGWQIVGVDENVACLQAAQSVRAGMLVLRGRARERSIGAYSISYDDAPTSALDAVAAQLGRSRGSAEETPCVSIEGDLTGDPLLVRFLAEVAPFDAVVCWLLGTHDARFCDEKIRAIGIRTADEYRVGMQRLVYQLADVVLAPGGVLHVVDEQAAGLVDARETVACATRAHALVDARETVACATRAHALVDARETVACATRAHGLSESAAAGLLRLREGLSRGTSLDLLSLDARGPFVSIRSRRCVGD